MKTTLMSSIAITFSLMSTFAMADGHHFYTATVAERNSCLSSGWNDDGAEGYISDADQGRIDGKCGQSSWVISEYDVQDRYGIRHVSGCVPQNTVALFRLFNSSNGDHFYSIDAGGVNDSLKGRQPISRRRPRVCHPPKWTAVAQ